ncbi:MAG: trigger factor, partial [Actinobacteria bacterium]|nr:trigger factor [Actinomycetota bacterium]
IIDVNFGEDYVLNEAASIAISELYPKIVDDSEIKPIDYPKIKINSIGKDKSLDFEITVEVEPEIELPKYKGIEVTGISENVYEEELEEQIKKLQDNYATLEPLEKEHAAVEGDFVIIDFEGKIDGSDFDGNSAQDYTLEIGSKTLFSEFESEIIGMKKGEHKDVTLTLPDNIASRDIAGKKADFSIDLKEIKKKSLPDLNEEFLANFGEYSSLEEFRKFLSERIAEQKKKARRDRIISDIMDSLVKNAKFDVPEQMIENRISRYNEDLQKELTKHKTTMPEYLKSFGLSEEQFNENVRQSAIREIREYLILISLEKAEAANIEPTDKQIAEESEKVLSVYTKDEEKNKLKEYLESEEGKKDFKSGLRRRNLFDFLIKNARIREEDQSKKDKSAKRKLWTPSGSSQKQQEQSSEKKLWVPGSDNIKESEDKK